MALAIILRLGVWILVPDTRFASDEQGYVQAGSTLAETGDQDLFWPPLTGWLVALVKTLQPAAPLSAIRLLWIAMDIGCVLAVRVLARRTAVALFGSTPQRVGRYTTLATAGYAVYLPAISHAQFVTSETPALLQLLAGLVLLTAPNAGVTTYAVAGIVTGTLVLTRPSLMPLLILLPAAASYSSWRRSGARLAAIFVVAGVLPIGAVVARNWITVGEPTISHNAAYNLYIGNQDLYAEDLNLFRPMATPEQIEFRRQYFSGELQYPALSPAEFQREGMAWIGRHPVTFVRRAVGRLARVFVPKTDVLELAGGERVAGVFTPAAMALLLAANLQWTAILFGGIVGLVWIYRAGPGPGRIYLAALAGSLALCVIAISKPRYSFMFDPLLILGVVAVAMAPREVFAGLTRADRRWLAAAWAFFAWGWVAWLIFAVSSRASL